MPLGIKAFVDFVFKKTFGSPENAAALIGLLNAILELDHSITEVTILNPFSYQEFATDKLVVLDVKAKDSTGRLLNIEMQISIHPGLLERLLVYVCDMYQGQMKKGEDYTSLNPAISICLLTGNLFPTSDQPHHCFQMMDRQSGRKLNRAIEVHTVELSKFKVNEDTVAHASPLEKWAWLILNAHEHSAAELRQLFPDQAFQQAIGSFETISSKTEDRIMHDQREKAERDQQWILNSVARKAHEEGREEGREEGNLTVAIRILQQILGEREETNEELSRLSVSNLEAKLHDLQQRVRSRLS